MDKTILSNSFALLKVNSSDSLVPDCANTFLVNLKFVGVAPDAGSNNSTSILSNELDALKLTSSISVNSAPLFAVTVEFALNIPA